MQILFYFGCFIFELRNRYLASALLEHTFAPSRRRAPAAKSASEGRDEEREKTKRRNAFVVPCIRSGQRLKSDRYSQPHTGAQTHTHARASARPLSDGRHSHASPKIRTGSKLKCLYTMKAAISTAARVDFFSSAFSLSPPPPSLEPILLPFPFAPFVIYYFQHNRVAFPSFCVFLLHFSCPLSTNYYCLLRLQLRLPRPIENSLLRTHYSSKFNCIRGVNRRSLFRFDSVEPK